MIIYRLYSENPTNSNRILSAGRVCFFAFYHKLRDLYILMYQAYTSVFKEIG